MTRHCEPRDQLIHAMHLKAATEAAAVASLMLMIQKTFGTAELVRIQKAAFEALGDEDALPYL